MFVSDWTKRSYRCLRMIISHIVFHYYRDAYAVAKCLIICSVWPFLTRQFSVDTTEHILIFLSSDNPTILVSHIKRDGNILTRSRLMETSKARGFEKITIFDQYRALPQKWCKIRRGHTQRNYTCPTQQCHFELPWVTLNDIWNIQWHEVSRVSLRQVQSYPKSHKLYYFRKLCYQKHGNKDYVLSLWTINLTAHLITHSHSSTTTGHFCFKHYIIAFHANTICENIVFVRKAVTDITVLHIINIFVKRHRQNYRGAEVFRKFLNFAHTHNKFLNFAHTHNKRLSETNVHPSGVHGTCMSIMSNKKKNL